MRPVSAAAMAATPRANAHRTTFLRCMGRTDTDAIGSAVEMLAESLGSSGAVASTRVCESVGARDTAGSGIRDSLARGRRSPPRMRAASAIDSVVGFELNSAANLRS